MIPLGRYQEVAGVGPTIDSIREYLLVLYARAYDIMDAHTIYGTTYQHRHTPEEIAWVRAHFDNMIKIAEALKEKKLVRLLRRLKNATLQHLQGKLSAEKFVQVLKKILKEYGIKTAELERIERKIDEIEARMKAEKSRRGTTVFDQMSTFSEKLFGGGRRPRGRAVRRPPTTVFDQMNRFSTRLFSPPRPPRRRMRKRPLTIFTQMDRIFGRMFGGGR